ncbi:HepT-like ribonuclease domain-containing protein [Granulicella sp. WH15]|uniref:HepT-like ribonuclease domain-containing protein n=1 Tax=Granulicella sp. WH15 TaxID=2602070 RepID=UPI0013A56412|nr:HepT-like ribonuclease domain-containing protein [Granulicella sp. WH15]
MPFRDPRTHFQDILDSIALIRSFAADLSLEEYRLDIKTKSAVERQLQIMTEAARRLGDDAELLCPGPDWRAIRDLGNVLRHAYHSIDDGIIWDAIHDQLPALEATVAQALAALNP